MKRAARLDKHDYLGVSCAMLAWAARHPHLEYWFRTCGHVTG
jgi:hypothetical protein